VCANVEVFVVVAIEDGARNERFELLERAGWGFCYGCADGDIKGVVVAMAVGVVALTEGCEVFFVGESVDVQSVGSSEGEGLTEQDVCRWFGHIEFFEGEVCGVRDAECDCGEGGGDRGAELVCDVEESLGDVGVDALG